MNVKPKFYIDVMERGRFICQVPYYGHGFYKIIDGNVVTVYDQEDLMRAVLEKRPSLSSHNINLALATQKVY